MSRKKCKSWFQDVDLFYNWLIARGNSHSTCKLYATHMTQYLSIFSEAEIMMLDVDQIISALHPNLSKRMVYNYRKDIYKFREYVMKRNTTPTYTQTATFVKGD